MSKLHQAARGSNPHRVVRLRKDDSHQRAGCERQHLLRREAVQAEHRADPDVAVAILEQRLDQIARQSRLHRRALDERRTGGRGVADAPESLAGRAHPEVAARVVQQTHAPPVEADHGGRAP